MSNSFSSPWWDQGDIDFDTNKPYWRVAVMNIEIGRFMRDSSDRPVIIGGSHLGSNVTYLPGFWAIICRPDTPS